MQASRILTIACAVVLAVIAGGLLASNIALSQTGHDQASIISTLSANNDALRKQVQAQGQTPVAPPAGDVIDQRGDPGSVGPQGPGATDSQVSRQLELYCAAHNDCTGPAGSNGVGTNGLNGTDGAPGADSTVPGPQGDPGTPGADGQPPMSWTEPGFLPGSTVTCTRTDPFDPSNPTYQCS